MPRCLGEQLTILFLSSTLSIVLRHEGELEDQLDHHMQKARAEL